MSVDDKLSALEMSLQKILWFKRELLAVTSEWRSVEGLLRDWYLSAMVRCNPMYSAGSKYPQLKENQSVEFQLLVETARLVTIDRNQYLGSPIMDIIIRLFDMDLKLLDTSFENLKLVLAGKKGVDLAQFDQFYVDTFVTNPDIYDYMRYELTDGGSRNLSSFNTYQAELARPNATIINHPILTRKFDNIKFDKVRKICSPGN